MNEKAHPDERCGHIAISYRHNVIVWGGYNKDNGFINPQEIWIYNINKANWMRKETSGDSPPQTSGSCAALIDTSLYIFGGCTNNGNSNKMFILDLKTCKWSEPLIESRKPSCRNKFGCWILDDRIIYFGGFGIRPSKEDIGNGKFVVDQSQFFEVGWNNDLVMFDVSEYKWTALPVYKDSPTPRAAHCCAKLNEKRGYLFGGRYKETRMDDLYAFEFDTYEWTRILTQNETPPGRSWHSFTRIDHCDIFLFGGLSTEGETMSDGWIFNVRNKEWNQIRHKHEEQPRIWHTGCPGIYEGQVVVFGGSSSNVYIDSDPSNSVLIFNLHPLPLVRLSMQAVIKYRKETGKLWKDLPCELKNELTSLMDGG